MIDVKKEPVMDDEGIQFVCDADIPALLLSMAFCELLMIDSIGSQESEGASDPEAGESKAALVEVPGLASLFNVVNWPVLVG